MSETTQQPVGVLGKIVALVVDVRKGEVAAVLASFLWIFCALTSYYIIKPIRSTMLQTRIGVDDKWIAILATAVFIGLLAWAYGKIVPHVRRDRLIVATFLAFIACVVAFALALPAGGKLSGYVFYVWVSTFNLMVVSQFWSLAAEVWSKEEGKRLYGFIGVGVVSGGFFGSTVVSTFAERLTIAQMLFVSAGLLGICLLLALHILRFAGRRTLGGGTETSAPANPAAPTGATDAITMVIGSPYLRLVAVMTLVLNLVNSNNEWILDKIVSRVGFTEAQYAGFYGSFFLVQNLLTLGIQLFVTARVHKRFGASAALLFLPLIVVTGGVAFLVVPTLFVIRWAKVLENATDYSIQSNTRELLYLPVAPLEKYSAKNFNDTFVVRIGDALAATSIVVAAHFLLPTLGDAGLRVLVAFDLVLGLLWLLLVRRIGRMHGELMRDVPPSSERS